MKNFHPYWVLALLAVAIPSQAQQMQQAGQQARMGRKTIMLSTVEGDRKCEKLVSPFDLTSNLGELTLLTAKQGAITIFSQITGQKPATGISNEIRTAAIRMNWLPMEAEVAYGEYQLRQWQDDGVILLRDEKSASSYKVADRLLAAALAEVEEAHPYRFNVFLRREANGNAQALPGGFILLDSDLVASPEKEPQATLFIAHEIAHILHRHETRAMQARVVDTISLAGGAGDVLKQITDIMRAPSTIVSILASSKLQFERHKMDQELHADACSVRIAQRALNNDLLLVKALNDFVAKLPPSEPEVKLQNTNMDLTTVGVLLSRSLDDRHPGGPERAHWFNAVLKELRDAGVAAPQPAAVPVPPTASSKGPATTRKPARTDATQRRSPP